VGADEDEGRVRHLRGGGDAVDHLHHDAVGVVHRVQDVEQRLARGIVDAAAGHAVVEEVDDVHAGDATGPAAAGPPGVAAAAARRSTAATRGPAASARGAAAAAGRLLATRAHTAAGAAAGPLGAAGRGGAAR